MSDTITVNKEQLEEINIGTCARYLAELGNYGIIPRLSGEDLMNAAIIAKKMQDDNNVLELAKETLARFEELRKGLPVTKADLEKLLNEINEKVASLKKE